MRCGGYGGNGRQIFVFKPLAARKKLQIFYHSVLFARVTTPLAHFAIVDKCYELLNSIAKTMDVCLMAFKKKI